MTVPPPYVRGNAWPIPFKQSAGTPSADLLLLPTAFGALGVMGFMDSVMDAAIGWLVQSILESFFTEQMGAWTREIGLAEDVEKLEFEIRNVEMVLATAVGRRIDNKPLAHSLESLRELLYDAEDVMDELDYHRLKHQIAKGESWSAAAGNNPVANYAASSTLSYAYQLICSARKTITSWVSSDRKRKREEEEPSDGTMLPLEIKHDISKRINRTVNNLQKSSNSVKGVLQLEISRLALMSYQRQSMDRNTRLTTSVPIEPKVYGRDAERDMIIEMLINEESNDLRVLPIVGTGGIGKTTLARFVYCDQRIIDHFDLQMWICVSTNFNAVRLTRQMLDHVCKDRQEYKDAFNVQQDILLRKVRDKKFLLILDDMWEDKDRNGWDTLLAPLKHSQVAGSVVLATTRSNSVAEMIGTMNSFQISGLDEEEFWLFFKACAFGNENYEGHHNLQFIGRQIAKALKGCPLAARSVGALLNRNVSHEHWRTVQDRWKSLQVKDDDIIPILKLSYDYLPFHLQRCFSYCSLFPEDYHFIGETLVQIWISRSFVQCEDAGRALEETGLEYLATLVDFGFFQKVGSEYAMHDLMHELADQVSSNECTTINGLQSNVIRPGIRHLSIITTGHAKDVCEKFEKIHKTRPSQKLRSLMLFGPCSLKLLKLMRALCKEAKCLRLLMLSVQVSSGDISSLYNLLNPYHLRYLEIICLQGSIALSQPLTISFHPQALKVCNSVNLALSQALTSFYHLQVLNVGGSRNHVNQVPTRMNNLVNLRHLIAHDKVHHAIAGVGKMTSLQELKFKARNVGNFGMRQLQSMNELVMLGISHLENLLSKEEASMAKLIDKGYLKDLSLSWDGGSMSLEPERTKEVLEGLQPHCNLRILHITRYSGPSSPTWLSSKLSVTSLQTLHLENCMEWRVLRYLEMLFSLRKLKLVNMSNLVELSIPSLEVLILIEMPKLEKCVGSYGTELTSHLRILTIKDCPQLTEFTPFQSCSSFKAEQKSWFPSLYKLTIERCLHISKWETLPLREMQALNELELIDLHAIRELSIPSLEKLVLIKMPRLECCSGITASPPLQISTSQRDQEWLSSLCKLTIRECPCLVVSHPLPPSAMMSTFSIKGTRTFTTMEMSDSRFFTIKSDELIMLDDKILAFRNIRGITLLCIEDCPNLVSLSNEGLNQLINLEGLSIMNCPNLVMSTTTPSARDEQLVRIPSNILHSLEELVISNCPDLEFGGAEGALRGYTSLKRLNIRHCPKLVLFLLSGVGVGLLPPSLQILEIDCPKLFAAWDLKLLEHGQIASPPLSLRILRISSLTDKFQSHLFSCLPTITQLAISASPELTSLQLGYSKALEHLEIVDCESLASIKALVSTTNLRSLTVYDSPNLPLCLELRSQQQPTYEIWSWLENLQISDGSVLTMSLCKKLTSLRVLCFCPKGTKRGAKMMGLTEEQEKALQILTSLQVLHFLYLPNFLPLPANLRRITSLKWLDISHCPRIARLPEMGLPPSLVLLSVDGCSEELTMQCRMAATEKLKVKIDDKIVD
uniref:NB-ARC domain-containing protein n=1 Tax=Oryza meridionalis TaxID=40149 RepID=A0A0E0DIJ6_9ORYZ